MISYIKILPICLLLVGIVRIDCNSTTIGPKNIDYGSDYDYDNQTNKKLFDVIEEQDLIDALRETEELQKKMNANKTKDEKDFKMKMKGYFETSDKNGKELEKNHTKYEKKQTLLLKKENPLVIGMLDRVETLSGPLMKRLLPIILPLTDELYDSNLSPLCMAALIRLGKGAKAKEVWALKWMDSMGTIPSGIFDGTIFSFGEYDQCLQSQMPATANNPELIIKGKYCLGGLSNKELVDRFSFNGGTADQSSSGAGDRFFGKKAVRLISREGYNQAISKQSQGSGIPDNLLDFSTIMDFTYRGNGLPIAVCIPDTCTAVEVNDFLNRTIYPKTGLPFGIAGGCHTIDEPIVLDTNQIVAISTFSVLFALLLIASFVDLFTKRNQNFRNKLSTKLLLSFSYQENLKTLSAPPKKIRCIDGIRVIATIWIFVAHSYIFNILMAFTWKRPNSSFLPRFGTDERYLIIRNAFLTETFFFLSAFLFTFIMFPKVERMKGRVEYFLLMTIRWMRFVPPLVASIFLLYLAPLFGSGPIFKSAYQTMNYPCYRNWHKNVLFINNLWLETIDEMCNGPSWYLSCDFQLFLIAPLFLVMLYKRPKPAMFFLGFLTFFGCFTALAPILWDKWPTADLLNVEDPEQLYIDLYYYLYPPYAHVSAYAMGILVGYLMRKYPEKCQNLNKLWVTAIWVISLALGVFSFTFNKDWHKPGHEASQAEVLVFVAIKSICISGFTCGLTFNCANGYGGFLDRFLSWRVWVPLGRLSMGVYLYQMPVIFHRTYSVKYSIEVTDNYIFTTVAYDCIFTFFLSFILYVIVEGPFGTITMLLMTPQPKTDKTLEQNFNKNPKLFDCNVQINGFKTNDNLKEVNNNNKESGRVNDAYVADEKL